MLFFLLSPLVSPYPFMWHGGRGGGWRRRLSRHHCVRKHAATRVYREMEAEKKGELSLFFGTSHHNAMLVVARFHLWAGVLREPGRRKKGKQGYFQWRWAFTLCLSPSSTPRVMPLSPLLPSMQCFVVCCATQSMHAGCVGGTEEGRACGHLIAKIGVSREKSPIREMGQGREKASGREREEGESSGRKVGENWKVPPPQNHPGH